MAKEIQRVSVSLTVGQLADLVNVLDRAWREGTGYGMVTRQEQRLLERHREQLLRKLERELRRHTCESTAAPALSRIRG